MKGGFCASEVSPACRSCWWMTRNSTNFLCCKLSKTHKPHSWWTRQAHTHIKTHTSPQIVRPLCPRSSSVRSDPFTCAHTRHLSQWGAVVTWPEEQQLWSICLSVSVSRFWISLFWLFCLAWVSWRVDMVFYFEGSQDQRSLGVVGVDESWCHWMWVPAHSQDDDWWDFSHLWHFSSVIIQFASCRETSVIDVVSHPWIRSFYLFWATKISLVFGLWGFRHKEVQSWTHFLENQK